MQQLAKRSDISRTVESTRTPLAEACEDLLKLLIETQQPYSITGLAKKSQLHRKTVEKCLFLLENLQKKWFENYRLRIYEVDNKKIIGIEKRTGLLAYPEELQNLIIKLEHFQHPSDDACLLLSLYKKKATTSRKAVTLEENGMTDKLVGQGQLKKDGKNFYLFLN